VFVDPLNLSTQNDLDHYGHTFSSTVCHMWYLSECLGYSRVSQAVLNTYVQATESYPWYWVGVPVLSMHVMLL